jgi:hypothetical protein
MENKEEQKIDRLDRIVTVRISTEDYSALQSISENKKSNISNIIRSMVSMVIDIVKVNNSKD